uniref:Secreted protein n=2 Tax=Anguilla anguilla TaxID=7936 RepID=A0A0E9UCH7_ANGAN
MVHTPWIWRSRILLTVPYLLTEMVHRREKRQQSTVYDLQPVCSCLVMRKVGLGGEHLVCHLHCLSLCKSKAWPEVELLGSSLTQKDSPS